MKKNQTTNILFCGIGGQGVLSASEVCGWAALYQGFCVKKSEVHGMAQRGGSVESHLRFGKKVFSPLIPRGEADFLVSFYKDEGLRMKDFLKAKTGIDLSGYLEKSGQALADKRYLNTFLVGVLSKYLAIEEDCWVKALHTVFEGKNVEENKKVFFQGRGEGL